MKQIKLFSFLLITLLNSTAYSQDCSTCSGVLSVDVDLSSNPDTVWITKDLIGRSGQCCHGSGSDNCIRFNVKTHPQAGRLAFTLADPPIPPSMKYALNCGPAVSVNDTLCISGSGPHCIVYCKPGGDLLKYRITVSRGAYGSPDITVGDGCADTIWAKGFVESTVKWNVIYPSSIYNEYLSCLSGCSQTIVSPTNSNFPEYIDVEVSGDLASVCGSLNDKKDTIRVYFVSDKKVEIVPKNPTICYGGTSVTLTADASGGAEPLKYLWNTGETTRSIDVS